MCLAVPGRIVEQSDNQAVIDLQGNRLKISTLLTPEATVGDWVLAHAGFAISLIDEVAARETWEWLRAMNEDQMDQTDTPPPSPHADQAAS